MIAVKVRNDREKKNPQISKDKKENRCETKVAETNDLLYPDR